MKLNQAQLAAIAAGLPAATVASLATADADPAQKTAEELAAEASALAATEAATKLAADEAATKLAAEEAAKLAAEAKADVPNPLVAHLTAQLAVAQAALVASEVKAASYQAAGEAQEGLLTIARESLSNKMVALGGSNATASTFTAQNIVAEHTRVSDLFKEKFKIGGVAAVATPAPKAAAIDPVFAATLQHSLPQ